MIDAPGPGNNLEISGHRDNFRVLLFFIRRAIESLYFEIVIIDKGRNHNVHHLIAT